MWIPTLLAPELPAIVPAPVGELAEDKQVVSHDVTCLPVSTNRSSPQTSLARLKAVSLCPPAIKPGLERPEDLTQFYEFYLSDLLATILCNDFRHSLINIKILQQTLCIMSIHLSILFDAS